MTSSVSSDFEGFIIGLGLRHEIAVELWGADICSPQELGSMEVAELRKISNNGLLVNTIHPILQKHVFNITMAKDPYKKAMAIMKKHVHADDDDEPMDTTNADSTSSDARCFVPGSAGATPEQPAVPRPTIAHTRIPEQDTSFSNSGVRMNVSGNRVAQSNFGFGISGLHDPAKKDAGHSVTITGGNFVQANVLGQGPVVYNNRNTVISTALDQNVDKDAVKKLRTRQLNETIFFEGHHRRLADLGWIDNSDYWLDRITMPQADITTYTQHMQSDDVYEIRGNKRALILNNSSFRANTRLSKRTGAEVDCRNMEQALQKLSFNVEIATNKTAAEMRNLLSDFATSQKNVSASMIAIYIGSHGERDDQGNDTFVGVDGDRVKFSDVRSMFGPENAPLLKKKPKLFFLQFCRISVDTAPAPPAAALPTQVSSDAGPITYLSSEDVHAMDLLCVYATLAGSKAYRDTEDGSWFVTAMIKVFSEHADKEDLLGMLTKVNNSISFNAGQENKLPAVQISEVVHNLRKKIYFYPGLL